MDAFITVLNDELRDRLHELWERTGNAPLLRIASGESFSGEAGAPSIDALSAQERSDWIGTAVMNAFKDTGDSQVFALLHHLSEPSFRATILGKLRRTVTRLDVQDVLQEVFLNIYRYPHRFVAERADSYRNWGHTIVRNTLLKMLKGEARRGRPASLDDDLVPQVDERAVSPLRSAVDSESAITVDRAFLIYLNLYLVHFAQLAEKEQRALTMVEVLGITYKDTAAELGIRLENLKMVIFRARRKILRGMTRTLAEIEARNARRAAAIREFKLHGGAVRDAVARDARADRLAPPPRSSLSTSA
ncbi:MAG: RNA polymerase sigma factor [Planctomycetes bacterium]|nr:RNA polymerase sigma factor [Planctomycetota bacterium]